MCITWLISLNYPKMAKIHITYSDKKGNPEFFFNYTVLTDHFCKNKCLTAKSLAESFDGQFYFKNHWSHSKTLKLLLSCYPYGLALKMNQLPKTHTILYKFSTDYRRRWLNGLLYDFSSILLNEDCIDYFTVFFNSKKIIWGNRGASFRWTFGLNSKFFINMFIKFQYDKLLRNVISRIFEIFMKIG